MSGREKKNNQAHKPCHNGPTPNLNAISPSKPSETIDHNGPKPNQVWPAVETTAHNSDADLLARARANANERPTKISNTSDNCTNKYCKCWRG